MDTELKKISRSPMVKGFAFLLVVVSFGIAATMFANLVKNVDSLEVLSERDYANSSELSRYQQRFLADLNHLLAYGNEENIKAGNSISKTEFEVRKRQLFDNWYAEQQIERSDPSHDEEPSLATVESKLLKSPLIKNTFEKEMAGELADLRQEMIDSEFREYRSLLQRVRNQVGLYYYANNGVVTYSNTDQRDRSYFAGFQAYYVVDKSVSKIYPINKNNVGFYGSPFDYSPNNTMYVAVNDEYLAQKQQEWDRQYDHLRYGIRVIVGAVLLISIGLFYLIWETGRGNDGQTIQVPLIDRLYTDITLLGILAVVFTWAVLLFQLIQSNLLAAPLLFVDFLRPDFLSATLLSMISCSLGLGLLLSLVRRLKNRSFVKESLTYQVGSKIWNMIRTVLTSGPLLIKIAAAIVVLVAAVALLSALIVRADSLLAFLSLLVLGALTVFVVYSAISAVRPLQVIMDGVQIIKEGQLDHEIRIHENSLFASLAKDVNTLADGLKRALAKEIKAERMKSELVTNVSHDLKTPLTSIITYADLLSKENLIPEAANEYVAVIKKKSERLKQMTQDLFEISRVQSGNITMEMERIDLAVLVNQSLAELEEQMEASELEFKVNAQEGQVLVLADGKRLSRALENLIQNVLKYALANTRVYLTVSADETHAYVECKNIANYEMNFNADEILERFVRGDQARTTEGSGLGLAIAQSNVAACGGVLKVTVDGDLFKVLITMNKASSDGDEVRNSP
ncbi:hypothetical protein GTO91_16690 [Heliobacterium undosum]|uniref:histidine kinase n=1 Tax=Heliomicrobium undosum TaxID=121734 RepID=A0A845L7S2_9FIRM|nr:HAMP domain-containing sensor histidine kinase [Heliomicrobium undosum]MZP31339.1 hypothetical protein [Heliomicrobium undosum]